MSKRNSVQFFIRSGLFIFIVSNLSSGLDAIFRTYLVRNLSTNEVGLFFSLLYSLSIFFAFSSSIDIFVTKKITEKNYHSDFEKESLVWFKRSFFYVLLCNIPIVFFTFIFRNFILKYYQFNNIFILYYLLIFYFLYTLITPFVIFLKGTRSFIKFNLSVFCFEISKVALLFIFIYSVFNLEKAYYTLILACIIYLSILVFFFLTEKKSSFPKEIFFWKSLRKYFKEYLYVLFFLLFFILLMNIHLVIVRWILPTEDSGKYSVVVMIRNVIVMISSPLIHLLFPFFIDLEKNNKRFKVRWIFLLFFANLLIALIINFLFYFFKEEVFANKYNDISFFVLISSINGVLLAIIQYIFFYYLMKNQSFKKYFLLLTILILNVIFILLFQSGLLFIIIANGVCFSILFFVSIFFIKKEIPKKKNLKNKT